MYNNNGFVKGIIAGLVVGAAVSMVSSNKQLQHMGQRMMRKSKGKAIRAFGNALDRISR